MLASGLKEGAYHYSEYIYKYTPYKGLRKEGSRGGWGIACFDV